MTRRQRLIDDGRPGAGRDAGAGAAVRNSRIALTAVLCLFWATVGVAQEMSPRFYWPAPQGTKVLIMGYSRASGDVLMDPSIPLFGVDSRINTGFLGYLQTFAIGGRTANLLFELPYSWGTTKGLVGDTPARRDFAGFNDAAVTLAVNLLGAPSMTAAEFQQLRAAPRPILGASLKFVPPTGYYQSDRLINVGANRWAAKLELGSVIPLKPRWLLEIEGGAWFFGDDDDYVAGAREQEPIYAVELHLVRRFRPGFWAALDFNYFTGGRQTIAGSELVDEQSNARIGGTIVVPFLRRQAVKIGFSTGTRTRFGTDFSQVLVTYQVLLP